MEHLNAKIYLNDLRGPNLFEAHQDSFGPLSLFNNEVLNAAKSKVKSCSGNTFLVLVPVTGDLIYSDTHTERLEVNVGQALIVLRPADFIFEIENPFDAYEISFLQLRIQNLNKRLSVLTELFDFDLTENQDHFTEIVSNRDSSIIWPFKMSIKRFNGREEILHTLKEYSGVFLYVLAGAFEVTGRLLHANDGLSLWNLPEVDMEALSNNAVLLMVELES
ncbi:MAG: hypothetical protein EOO92_02020 [Pedobacter sp.]|nr:MAG: hypothetical protein EOO92_02020 [Pedobacter sp.]